MSVAKNINSIDDSNAKIKIRRLTESYSIVPNSFAQSEKLSMESIAVGVYLNSLPADWIPRPVQIQKHFNFGDRVWRKISKELREFGYLRLEKGGNTGGGTHLEFDIRGFYRDVQNERVPIPETCIPETFIPDTFKMNGHTNYTSVQNNNKTTTTEPPATSKEKSDVQPNDSVVYLINRLRDEACVTEKDAHRFLSTYTVDQITEKLSMLKKAKPTTPAAWLRVALRDDFKERKSQPLTLVSSIDDSDRLKHIQESHHKHWQDRLSAYEAAKTEDQIRQQQDLLKRYGPRKRDARSALM